MLWDGIGEVGVLEGSDIEMMKIGEALLYFFCFFPFITIFKAGGGTDVQPYALCIASLIMSVFIIIKWKIIVNKNNIFFYILSIIATVILGVSVYINHNIFHCIRSYFSYINLSLISICTYMILKKRKNYALREGWIKAFINIWLMVGLIQRFLDRNFLNAIVSNSRTTSNRGVCSLASEPSFYGYMCLFFLFFIFLFKKQRFFYIANVLFQILFLAQSSTTLVYLCVLSFWYCIKILGKMDIKKIIISCVLCICILPILSVWAKNNQNVRIGNLVYQVVSSRDIKDLLELIERDESIYNRVKNITFCFSEFIKGYGMPHGFLADKRIESGYGMALYELGIIGILLFVIIWRVVYRAYPKKYAMVVAHTLTFVMFSAVQLSLPTLAFFIGYCCYRCDKNYEEFVENKSVCVAIVNRKALYVGEINNKIHNNKLLTNKRRVL